MFRFPVIVMLQALLVLPVAAQISTRPGMGAIPYSGGVTFRVWAPNASSVAVRGEFNGWGQTALSAEGNGHWSRDIAGAQIGQPYKYFINGSLWRRDPRARRVENTNGTGNSFVYNPSAFDWGAAITPTPVVQDLVIYQMHVGTFAGGSIPNSFDQAITRLDHVRDLGVTAIKLLPVNEFGTSLSWGYNPSDQFAIESGYGGPDALKRFVKACHERGIGVFYDVVHNHYGPENMDIYQFDGWSVNNDGGIYFYNNERATTDWGLRPNFGRDEVRAYIRDQIFMFADEYRASGFRWDSAYNILNANNVRNDEGISLLAEINRALRGDRPDVIRGSEDNAFDHKVDFENQWDVGYRWALYRELTNTSDSARNMNNIANLLRDWSGLHRVVFTEAHDYVAARNDNRTRVPTDIDPVSPEGLTARKRALLGASIVMATPGKPMIFQGQEMHETLAFADNTPLRWTLTNTHAGIVRAYRDLIHARRNLRGGTAGLRGAGIDVHHVDNTNKVVGFIRWDQGGQTDDAVVVANFSATAWTNESYQVRFPSAGTWYRRFNGDAVAYGSGFAGIGDDVITVGSASVPVTVNMGAYSAQIFTKSAPGTNFSGVVYVTPRHVEGCGEATITYHAQHGPLAGRGVPTIRVTRNEGRDPVEALMTPATPGVYTYRHAIAPGTHSMRVAFHDGAAEAARVRDDKNGEGWSFPVFACPAELEPVALAVTNIVDSKVVENEVERIDLSGVASGLSGSKRWTNELTGGSGEIPVDGAWAIAGIDLGVGTNAITIAAAGVSVAGGILAWDRAGEVSYTGGWASEDNGGGGFASWQLTQTANAGHFIRNGWGMWANSGGVSEAFRPLGWAMSSGETVRVQFKNGTVQPGGSVSFALVNDAREALVEFNLTGGQSVYRVHDALSVRSTGLGVTTNAFDLAITLTGTNTYRLQAGTQTITGTFTSRVEGAVAGVRARNSNAGSGSGADFFINQLIVTAESRAPVPVEESVEIIRLAAAETGLVPRSWREQFFGSDYEVDEVSDFDGDGQPDWKEFIAGTDPTNVASRLNVEVTGVLDGSSVVLRWPGATGRVHTLEQRFSLTSSYDVVASGIPSTAPWTSYTAAPPDRVQWFYRVSTSLAP